MKHPSVISFVCLCILCACQLKGVLAEDHPGKAIYIKQCASCHGQAGQGVETLYPEPLVGDLSVKQLSSYISETMPEDDPSQCTGDQAEAVAAFIHGEFYSLIAQVRNAPPQRQFSRLTVAQHRNSMTDLAASFIRQKNWGEQRGLMASYYDSRRKNKESKLVERTDPIPTLDFSEGRPEAELKNQEDFAVDWNGGLQAPETGWYEIIIKTDNGGQLWLNDLTTPLIDARVKSGDQIEYTGNIFLLGGRIYPIKIEFLKSKSEKTSSFELKWRRPHGQPELITERYLSADWYNYTLVVDTDFPPDDKSVGYERGVSVSQAWNDACTTAAIQFADLAMLRLQSFVWIPKEETNPTEKLKNFCYEFVSRAFRRPLSDEMKAIYVDRQFASAPDPQTATKRVMLLTLKSPRFLFPGTSADEFDDFRNAEWLALAIWDSLPDEQLRKLAAQKKLNTPEQIEQAAAWMADDPKALHKMRAFFHQWLHFEHFQELSKSSEKYPQFTPQLAADLRTSLQLFLDEVVHSENADYRQLLLAKEIYVNQRLADYYGITVETGERFTKVPFEPEQRSGIISHPYLLAGLAYEQESSPIHRGVFLSRSLLGRFLKPPPIAIAPTPVDLAPDLTNRERVEHQTSAAMCANCHTLINPLGFALENYDAVGRFRSQDNGKPVNASVVYIDRADHEVPLTGARQLAEFLARSPEARHAVTEQLFQFALKQPVQAFGLDLQSLLQQHFLENQFHLRKQLAYSATQSLLIAREQAKNELAQKN